jgi:hypothetical protein
MHIRAAHFLSLPFSLVLVTYWWAQLVILTRLLSFLCHVGPPCLSFFHLVTELPRSSRDLLATATIAQQPRVAREIGTGRSVGWRIKARLPPRPSLISCQCVSNPDPPPQRGKKKGGHRDQSSSSLPCSWGRWIPPARVGIKSAATYCLVQTPSPSAFAVGSRCNVGESFRRGVTSPSFRDSKADPGPWRGSGCLSGCNTGVREAVGSSTSTGRRRFFTGASSPPSCRHPPSPGFWWTRLPVIFPLHGPPSSLLRFAPTRSLFGTSSCCRAVLR